MVASLLTLLAVILIAAIVVGVLRHVGGQVMDPGMLSLAVYVVYAIVAIIVIVVILNMVLALLGSPPLLGRMP